jgi:hypothetical protein
METFAYFQVDEAGSEKELTLETLKMSGKLAGIMLSAAGAAIAVGVTQTPAQANNFSSYGGGFGSGHGGGCGSSCGPTYVGSGYQVTSYQTYDVSFDSGCGSSCNTGWSGGSGCSDYCGVSWGGGGNWGGGGWNGGCYDSCGVSWGGGGWGNGCGSSCNTSWGGGNNWGCGSSCGVSWGGGGWGGCSDSCGVATPYSSISYGGGSDCYDYCGVSYGGGGFGDSGTFDIQVALSNAGFGVSVDGVYGPETHYAVVAFQQAVGLVPDGVVGPATASALGLY